MLCDKCQKWGENPVYKCHIPSEYEAIDKRYGTKAEIIECKFFRERLVEEKKE